MELSYQNRKKFMTNIYYHPTTTTTTEIITTQFLFIMHACICIIINNDITYNT